MDINDTIRENIGLIAIQLKKLHLTHDQDAESLAYEALYKAVVNYDESYGYKFSTLASCYIYNALGSYIRKLNKKRQLEIISYNAPIGDTGELLDIIYLPGEVSDDCIRRELYNTLNEAFTDVYNELTNQNKRAIVDYWKGKEYNCTATEVAKAVGVSQPYVSMTLSAFKYSLKKRMEELYND